MNTEVVATDKAKGKKEVEVELVAMEDGRKVEFAGKKRVIAEGERTDDGMLGIRVDFRNGETRFYPFRTDMLEKFAVHGGKQKYIDQLAGAKDESGAPIEVDDMVLELDALHKQLYVDGDWRTVRESNGMAGTSTLLRALVEFTNKTRDEVKAQLETLNQKQKLAIRLNPKIKVIIDRIEAEKAAKGEKIDTEQLLTGFLGQGAAAPAAA